jgi:acetyl esterase
MISGYGIYSAFCAYLASELHCVVLDADYALGPEYQFPGAYDDVVDVVSHVLSSMRTFDTDRITMGGVSSGGSLAICVTATAPVANNRIKGIVATCVPIDFNRSGESLHSTAPPRPSSKFPGITLAAGLWDLTRKVYVPPSHSSDDPRISPIAVDTSLLPPTMIICGEYDVLRPDGEAFGEKIIMAGGVAEVEVIEGVGHGWDTAYYKPGTLGAKKVQEGWEITRKSLAGCQKRVFE